MQVSEQEQVWTAVTQLLRDQLTESVWMSTFSEIRPLDVSTSSMRVSVPSRHVRERIQTRYLPIVTEALGSIVAPGCDLEMVVDPAVREWDPLTDDPLYDGSLGGPHAASRAGSHGGPGSDVALAATPNGTTAIGEAGLNPRYTFETFVKGASNQFALAASLRVAETPARSYNPLFIYGAAGLGKTHLLHAIGHYVHSNYQHYEVRYVSTETFLNEFVDAIRNNATTEFKRRYRDIDVLLIDDIQFLENREGLQEEFFHTFNSLHGADKQIVISSDRPPDAIPTLEDRLRGRFKWGLITDVQPPDLETRLAILRNKAERDHVEVPADTLEFIATKISNNIRELEGALIRVTAFASLNQVPITTELAQTLLADLLRESAPKRRTDNELLEEIADILGFEVAALKGKSRQRPLVTARQIAMYVFRDLTDLSYPAIARVFGGRDHTTVIHAVEKIQRLMSERKQIYDQVTDLIQRLKA
jgi:chromosomal replication initiator protein